jgi:hypothetical protein
MVRASAAPARSSNAKALISKPVRAATTIDSGGWRRSKARAESSTWRAFRSRTAPSGGRPRCSTRGAASAVGVTTARDGPRALRTASPPDTSTGSTDAVTRPRSSPPEPTSGDAVPPVVATCLDAPADGAERWDGATAGADRTGTPGPMLTPGVPSTRPGAGAGRPGTSEGDPTVGSGAVGTTGITSSGPTSGATSGATTGCGCVGSEPSTTRGGRKRRGSRYPSATLARRTPRCTYGTGCSLSPLDPAMPTMAPSATRAPRVTSDEPRWAIVTESPSSVRSETTRPCVGTTPTNVTVPSTGATTSSFAAPPTSIPRCWPGAYASAPSEKGLSTSPCNGHDQAPAGPATPRAATSAVAKHPTRRRICDTSFVHCAGNAAETR